ncbi:MAG TPA: hypothetical protein VH478_03485 [Trebonia sp.]|jgi:hypothetical protein|nr:hypothetical protein [Trebonia sp.]
MWELYTAATTPEGHGIRAAALAKRTLPPRAMAASSADFGARNPVRRSASEIAGQRATRTLTELSKFSQPGVGDEPHPTFTLMPE